MYDYEIAIIGAGAAGCSAAIYGGRGGASIVVFDKGMGGGLATEAPKIENYPGFKSITGIELMEKIKEHAMEYADMKFGEEVKEIRLKENGVEVITNRGKYWVGAVIICTGSKHRKLNVKGEEKFAGKGVSYCATCDGFFFKGKKVAVIGGGNSAIIEAIYLRQLGCNVYVIHRRDELRAEKALEKEAEEKGIKFLWNSIVKEILGDEKVKALKIKNLKTNDEKIMEIDGVFISIGEEPQSNLAKKVGIKTDENGYIITDEMGRTNISRIFAAGDVTGGVRQVITACAEGAKAALAALKIVGKRSPF